MPDGESRADEVRVERQRALANRSAGLHACLPLEEKESDVTQIAARCRFLLTGAATIAATALLAAPAMASVAPAASGCPETPVAQPFAQWGDTSDYFIAPGGSFEQGAAGWTLHGKAAVTAGNEPWAVNAAGDAGALRLQAGSSATTAPFCIGVEHRSMRFFVKGAGAKRTSSVKVDVLYANRAGKVRSRRIGRIRAGADWTASPSLPLVVNRLAARRGNAMQVSLRFTAKGGGISIDDVYVDPWRSH
jgi:hypothetical protein